MRWHVQGTDAVTGPEVERAVNEPKATPALAAARDHRVPVPHVGRETGRGGGGRAGGTRVFVPLAVALLIALADVSTGLHLQNVSLRRGLDQALAEETHMASSLEQAEHTAASLRAVGMLAQEAANQAAQLADQLGEVRAYSLFTEEQLAAAQRQVSDLAQSARQVPVLESQLAAFCEQLDGGQKQLQSARELAARLRTELAMQGRRLDELQNAPPTVDPAVARLTARLAELEQANAGLAAQLDTLKAELLVAVARPPEPPPAPEPPEPAPAEPPAPSRWALRISYDTAHAFLVLHSDHNSVISAAVAGGAGEGGEPLIASTAAVAANAVQFKVIHDRERQRVYSAALSVSLATDAPRDILAENKALVGDYLRTFVPGLKDINAVIASTAQLAGQDESRQLVFLAEDSKVTLWKDRTGVYTFRVESAHEE